MKRKIFSVFFALVLVCSLGLVTAVPAGAVEPETVVLGGDVAPLVNAQGSSAKYHIGDGCWQAVPGDSSSEGKMELYIDPTSAPFDSLGTFTIDDIASISYWTDKPGAEGDPDFYLAIYTVGDGMGWYEYRLNAEPLYSNGLDAPANDWNQWSTGGATNQLTFFDSNTTVAGFYNGPTLADLQAGSIDWGSYPTSGSMDVIDYGAETVKYITFQTGTPWCGTFEGNIDAITISLTGGASVTIDLEEYYNEVWVDDDATGEWYALPGNFANIQDGIDNVAEGGTVNVAAGDYGERVTINKGLTLLGANWGIHPAVGTHLTETVGTRVPESVLSELGTQVVKPYADDITIDGFKLLSPFKVIYTYEDANNFHLTNCIFENRTPTGETVVLFGSGSHTDMLIDFNLFQDPGDRNLYFGGGAAGIYDRLHIAYNKFNGMGTGVFWAGETLVDGIIEGNEFDGTIDGTPGVGGPGLNMAEGGNIIIRNNWFHDMSYTGFQVGIIGGSVIDNTFEDTYPLFYEGSWVIARAFELWGGEWETPVSTNVTIAGNTIKFNDQSNDADEHGIRLRAGADAPNIHINANNFVDGGVSATALAVMNLGTGIADAEYNWWADATGPYHATANPDGLGGAVSDDVDFMPWYATETTTAEREYVTVRVGDTEEVRAYSDTIQDGIDAACPGDTILVNPGTYYEFIQIDKALTVKSTDGAEETIIDGIAFRYMVDICSSDVTFEGFTVTNPTYAGGSDATGILIQSTGAMSNVHILNNIVTQVRSETGDQSMYGATGINIGKGPLSNVVISGNTIKNIKNPDGPKVDHTCGINVWDGAEGVEILNNTISDIKYNGIMLQWASNVQIAGNSITECETGIRVEPFEGATVSGYIRINNIVGNEVGVYNWAEQILNATYNWWGSVNGPGQDGANDILGDVDYSPWLPGEWDLFFDLEKEDFIDSDGDGFSDLEEYWLGTDPNDPESLPGAAIDPGQVDNAYVEGDDPGEVNLQDSEGGTIANVDISGGGDVSGTITGARYTDDPGETSLSVGTGTTGVVFLDVKVTGYTEGIAHIIVPYPDEEPDPEGGDGIVDDTGIVETTLGLYYWDEAALPDPMWRLADNNVVDTLNNNVSGDIPISALTGTPIGGGGYLEDEAAVAIESILDLSFSGEDTVKLTIDTNTAFLGAATVELMFDPMVVEVLGVVAKSSDFDSLTVNPDYGFIGNNIQIARFVAHQAGADGVDATDGAVVAVVKLLALGSTMEESPLTLELVTLKDNKGDTIPFTLGDNDSIAIVGGIGDANRDGVVDAMDLVYIECAIAGFTEPEVYSIDTPTMDVSGDDIVDAWDCTYLARHLAGDPEYPLGG